MAMAYFSVTIELEPPCAIKTAAEQNAATDERVTVAAFVRRRSRRSRLSIEPLAGFRCMQHTRKQTPAYFVWVEARPTHRGKGRPAYYAAVQQAAQKVIATPITARDIEVEIASIAMSATRSCSPGTNNL